MAYLGDGLARGRKMVRIEMSVDEFGTSSYILSRLWSCLRGVIFLVILVKRVLPNIDDSVTRLLQSFRTQMAH
jgi:hypothetical protein